MPPDAATFKINPELSQRIGELAREGYPDEICGFLLGRDSQGRRHVTSLVVANNREGSEARRRFLVDKDQYQAAEAEAEREGLTILGVFHSHPDAPAVPSATDSEFAFPGWVYWITPVSKAEPGEARVWLRSEDAGSWDELEAATGSSQL